MGAEPIGLDPSGGRIVILTPLPSPKKKSHGAGGAAASSTAGETHTHKGKKKPLAFAERGDGFGPAAGQQFEESLLQRFFSLARRVAWKKEGVTEQKKS